MKLICPGCESKLTIAPKLFGKTVACPRCKKKLKIPAGAPVPKPKPKPKPMPMRERPRPEPSVEDETLFEEDMSDLDFDDYEEDWSEQDEDWSESQDEPDEGPALPGRKRKKVAAGKKKKSRVYEDWLAQRGQLGHVLGLGPYLRSRVSDRVAVFLGSTLLIVGSYAMAIGIPFAVMAARGFYNRTESEIVLFGAIAGVGLVLFFLGHCLITRELLDSGDPVDIKVVLGMLIFNPIAWLVGVVMLIMGRSYGVKLLLTHAVCLAAVLITYAALMDPAG